MDKEENLTGKDMNGKYADLPPLYRFVAEGAETLDEDVINFLKSQLD